MENTVIYKLKYAALLLTMTMLPALVHALEISEVEPKITFKEDLPPQLFGIFQKLLKDFQNKVHSKGRGLGPADHYKARINETLVSLLILGNEINGATAEKVSDYKVEQLPLGAQNLGIFVINTSPPIFVKFLGNQSALYGGDLEVLYEDALATQKYLLQAQLLMRAKSIYNEENDEISFPKSAGVIKIEDLYDNEMSFYWVASQAASGKSLSSLLEKHLKNPAKLNKLADIMGKKLAYFHKLFLEKIEHTSNPFGIKGILSEFKGQLHGDLQPNNIFLQPTRNSFKMTLIDVDGIGFYAAYKKPVAADALYFLKQTEKTIVEDLNRIYGREHTTTILHDFFLSFAKTYSSVLLDGHDQNLIDNYSDALMKYMEVGQFEMGLVNQIGPQYEEHVKPQKLETVQ